MNNSAAKVGEIFREAGTAFNKLSEMTMSLHSMDESPAGGKWSEEEVEILRGCVNRFAVELNKISQHIKNRTMFHISKLLQMDGDASRDDNNNPPEFNNNPPEFNYNPPEFNYNPPELSPSQNYPHQRPLLSPNLVQNPFDYHQNAVPAEPHNILPYNYLPQNVGQQSTAPLPSYDNVIRSLNAGPYNPQPLYMLPPQHSDYRQPTPLSNSFARPENLEYRTFPAPQCICRNPPTQAFTPLPIYSSYSNYNTDERLNIQNPPSSSSIHPLSSPVETFVPLRQSTPALMPSLAEPVNQFIYEFRDNEEAEDLLQNFNPSFVSPTLPDQFMEPDQTRGEFDDSVMGSDEINMPNIINSLDSDTSSTTNLEDGEAGVSDLHVSNIGTLHADRQEQERITTTATGYFSLQRAEQTWDQLVFPSNERIRGENNENAAPNSSQTENVQTIDDNLPEEPPNNSINQVQEPHIPATSEIKGANDICETTVSKLLAQRTERDEQSSRLLNCNENEEERSVSNLNEIPSSLSSTSNDVLELNLAVNTAKDEKEKQCTESLPTTDHTITKSNSLSSCNLDFENAEKKEVCINQYKKNPNGRSDDCVESSTNEAQDVAFTLIKKEKKKRRSVSAKSESLTDVTSQESTKINVSSKAHSHFENDLLKSDAKVMSQANTDDAPSKIVKKGRPPKKQTSSNRGSLRASKKLKLKRLEDESNSLSPTEIEVKKPLSTGKEGRGSKSRGTRNVTVKSASKKKSSPYRFRSWIAGNSTTEPIPARVTRSKSSVYTFNEDLEMLPPPIRKRKAANTTIYGGPITRALKKTKMSM